jgi:hypothetical protein
MSKELPQQINYVAFSLVTLSPYNKKKWTKSFAPAIALLGDNGKYTVYIRHPETGLKIKENVTYTLIMANKLMSERYRK